MLDLDSDRWKGLSHAYGNAQDVPGMLRDLAAHPTDEVWERIWSSLCHQGDTYSASCAAVPHIVALAERLPLKEQVMYWAFVAAVAADAGADGYKAPWDVQQGYREALSRSAPVILKALLAGPADESDAAYLLEALAAVRGCEVPARHLSSLLIMNDIHSCPRCEASLSFAGSDEGLLLCTEEDDSERKRTWVAATGGIPPSSPPEVKDLDPEKGSEWLPRLAAASGHPGLGRQIRMLFEPIACPECDGLFIPLRELP